MFENLVEYIRTHLSNEFTLGEIRAFTTLILKDVCNLSFSDIVACKFTELSDNEKQNIISIVKRLQNGEPIQYILGVTEFYGLDFKVTPSVLIPRPETEELVEWILLNAKQVNPHILDIGTGSGCIAIALAKKMKYATVDAWDVSVEALTVAQQNAIDNSVSIKFLKVDVLEKQNFDKKFDIIVSNPPYIKESEKEEMSKNVLDFEPHQALFVSDHDALIFYKRIADIAMQQLNKRGMLYFEINQAKGHDIVQLLQDKNFIEIELKKDISGNYRMIRAMKD